MRISDWSSDVCSSDLLLAEALLDHAGGDLARAEALDPRGAGDLAQAAAHLVVDVAGGDAERHPALEIADGFDRKLGCWDCHDHSVRPRSCRGGMPEFSGAERAAPRNAIVSLISTLPPTPDRPPPRP